MTNIILDTDIYHKNNKTIIPTYKQKNMTSSELNKNVSLNTKLIVLFVIIFQLLAFVLNENSAQLAIVTMISLIFVLIVDYYFLFKGRYKKLWTTIKWTIFGVIIILTSIGFKL